jgi:hypothetical protein
VNHSTDPILFYMNVFVDGSSLRRTNTVQFDGSICIFLYAIACMFSTDLVDDYFPSEFAWIRVKKGCTLILFMSFYYQQIAIIKCNRCVHAWRVVIRIFTVFNVTYWANILINTLSALISSSQISCSANKPTKSPTLVCKAPL